MKNITVKLDDDTARWLRVTAAEHDMSISAWLAALLADARAQDGAYLAAEARFLERPGEALSGGASYPAREALYDRKLLR